MSDLQTSYTVRALLPKHGLSQATYPTLDQAKMQAEKLFINESTTGVLIIKNE